MHAYIHTYIHTYIHAYIHTSIHTCIHTCIHTYIHAYMHTFMHACIRCLICIRNTRQVDARKGVLRKPHKHMLDYTSAFLLERRTECERAGADRATALNHLGILKLRVGEVLIACLTCAWAWGACVHGHGGYVCVHRRMGQPHRFGTQVGPCVIFYGSLGGRKVSK